MSTSNNNPVPVGVGVGVGAGEEEKENNCQILSLYEDEELGKMDSNVSPLVYRYLQEHLPSMVRNASWNDRKRHMDGLLDRCLQPHKVKRRREHRQKIFSNYHRLHNKLYTLDPEIFFVPSFHRAITDNTEESLRKIVSEPSPGLFTFDMLDPHICEMMLSEVQNYEKYVKEGKFDIMRPNTMNKYGLILNDCGFQPMLDKLMNDFVRPISKVFLPKVGGDLIDSHHGFIVQYGKHRDTDLGFHVDDSDVTLNVCLGNQFSGGELYFRGVRCDKHINSEPKPEENFDYKHVPGRALLHCGRHRHGARATTSGYRVNLLLWCKRSVFGPIIRVDCSDWCGECQREKQERQQRLVAEAKQRLRFVRRVDAES